MTEPSRPQLAPSRSSLLHRLRERGVIRVAASYAVISWLALQIASVVIDPLGLPKWVMTALIIAAAVGFPIAIALAWFLELGEHGVEMDTAAEGVPRPTSRGLRHYADAVVIGVLLIAVVVLLVRQSDIGKPQPPANPAIAVLPFENLSGDPEQEYFSDGLAEEMLDRLGRVPGLKVIARSSSFGFKGQDLDARTIAEKLGVTTVLEGSVRRDGTRLKLNARLIDGSTGRQAWSGSFDREMNDLFAVQAELASAIVDAIIPAARGEVATAPKADTSDLSAYDLYLLARAQFAIQVPSTLEKAVDLMEQATRLDPNFARAHALRAASLLSLRQWALMSVQGDPDEMLGEAERSIHRALAIDPDLSEAHAARGNLLRDTARPGAEEAYRRAIRLNPNNAAAWHDYAVYLGSQPRRAREFGDATRRSLGLDPRQPETWANYLTVVASEGRARFDTELARAMSMVGDMPAALGRLPLMTWARNRDEYRAEFARVLGEHGDRPESLDLLVIPASAIRGFPAEVMAAGIAKRRLHRDEGVPVWIHSYRAWLAVDPVRAERALPARAAGGPGFGRERTRLMLLAEVAGLQGDWARLDGIFKALLETEGQADRQVRAIMAFWLAVQGRYDQASASLELAGAMPDERNPPVLGNDRLRGLMETAMVRIFRGTGRQAEAQRLVSGLLPQLRAEWRANRSTCKWDGWMLAPMRYASLAANEGLEEEAVGAIRDSLRCGDLPYGFWPQLPWFKSLEGYAPYDEIVRERERRIERISAELATLEAQNGGPTPGMQ